MNLPFNLSIDQDQISTFFRENSSALFQKIVEANPSFANLLSATQILSAIPYHPYDRMKYDLFGPEHKFLTIDDLKIPENFNLAAITEDLHNIQKQMYYTGVSAASAFAIQAQSLSANLINLEQSYYNEDLTRKNIEFSEVVKSLTIDQIEANPREIAQKLVSHFVTLYK